MHVRLEPVVGVLDLSLASGTHTSLLSAGYSVSKSGVSLQASLMGRVPKVDVQSTSEGRLVIGIDFLASLNSGGTGGNSRMRLRFEVTAQRRQILIRPVTGPLCRAVDLRTVELCRKAVLTSIVRMWIQDVVIRCRSTRPGSISSRMRICSC